MNQTHRLTDQIFQVFNLACGERRLDVAELLLAALEIAQEAAADGQPRSRIDAKAAEKHLRRLRQRDGAMH